MSHQVPLIVLSTVPNETIAATFAKEMVEARLAACVHLVLGVRSVYRWQDSIQHEAEVQLVIKTTTSQVESLENWIHTHHPYDLPEFIVLPVISGSNAYLKWLDRETRPQSST